MFTAVGLFLQASSVQLSAPLQGDLIVALGNTERSVQDLANELKAHEELNVAVMAAASAKYDEERGEPCYVPTQTSTGKCDKRKGRTDSAGKCKEGSTERKSFKVC